MISAIVVVGKNREIGCNNKLLWDLPEDMERFKKLTTGHVVIMGDKTYESMKAPLPKRENVVISLDDSYQAPGCHLVHSIDAAINKAYELDQKGEVFVIGGGTIYRLMLPYTEKLYITEVEDAPKADTYFPDYSEFKNIVSSHISEHNGLKYKFLELTR